MAGYQFQQVRPATYTLTIESPGFSTEVSVVQLLVSQPATFNMVLHLVATNTTVEVDAGAGEAHQYDQCGRRQRRRREDSRGTADGRQKRPRPAKPAARSALSWP